MSHEPKKRHSRARQGKRRSSIKLTFAKSVICKNCGEPQISHTVCRKCGYYNNQSFSKLQVATAKESA